MDQDQLNLTIQEMIDENDFVPVLKGVLQAVKNDLLDMAWIEADFDERYKAKLLHDFLEYFLKDL